MISIGLRLVLVAALFLNWPAVLASPGGLRIVGPNGEATPVVNELGRLQLRVVDQSGAAVVARSWRSDNIEVAKIKNGKLKGRRFGFATVTAQTNSGDVSAFVAVTRVANANGASAAGEAETDSGGNVYLSSPQRHVIYRASEDGAGLLAGKLDDAAYFEGTGSEARFDGPAGLGVDNRADGGLYVADTANHCVRKIDFRGRSTLAVGAPRLPGTMHGDETALAEAVLSGPRGVATLGSSLFVTDTENHCIWFVDPIRGRVQLVAGTPGQGGLADGVGRDALFNRPSGIAISTNDDLLAVADTENGIVRLIGLTARTGGGFIGEVTTLGLASSARGVRIAEKLSDDLRADAIAFTRPESVSFDGVDNVYVVDASGASVVTRSRELVERVALAQSGTFLDPASVTVRRTQTYVLDASATNESEAVKLVEVGPPSITSASPSSAAMEGGALVTIEGKNFAKESRLTLGDAEVTDYTVERSTRITFVVPPQLAPGGRTLTVATRGGVAQKKFTIVARPLAEISAGDITTIYGGIPYLGDGGPAVAARLSVAAGVCIDAKSNVYVSDGSNNRIRRIDAATGLITTVAGTGIPGFSGDGGPALAATIAEVTAMAIDPGGNLYLADYGNNRIRRVDAATGIISTVVGSDEFGFSGDGGLASNARIYIPSAVAFDADGHLYFSDLVNGRIRRIDAHTGRISTVAGNGEYDFTGDGGPATSAAIGEVNGLAFDGSGNMLFTAAVYGTQVGSVVRRVEASSHTITTIAGGLTSGYSGDGGSATLAELDTPLGLAADVAGNVFVADYSNHAIRRIDATTRIISTFAGTHQSSGPVVDGVPASQSIVPRPAGVAIDGSGNLLLADVSRVRVVDADTGLINTMCGGLVTTDIGDGGPLIEADLAPRGVEFDSDGSMLIPDSRNGRVRRVDSATGIVSTVAGGGTSTTLSGDGGPAIGATINGIGNMALAGNGDLYVSELLGLRVRRVRNGTIATVAGTGVAGNSGDGGPAASASFRSIADIACDADGHLYIADRADYRIRRVDAATGSIQTFAGTGVAGVSGDGGPATSAGLGSLGAIDVSPDGSLLIDDRSGRIRRVASGVINTVAGRGSGLTLGDGGPATSANLRLPTDALADRLGNIFIFDGQAFQSWKRLRRVDATSRIITTIAGNNALGYSGDGGRASAATLGDVRWLAIDAAGNVYLISEDFIRVVKGAAM